MARLQHLPHRNAVQRRLPDALPDRRHHRRLPRRRPGRLRAARHLLRGRPLPLHHVDRGHLRLPRRLLLLVPQNVRQVHERGPRQAALLAALHRRQRDLLHPTAARPGRHAAPHQRLRGQPRLGTDEHPDHNRRVRLRRRHDGLPLQRVLLAQIRRARLERPLGRDHAGVGDDLAAAPAQLRLAARDPLGAAALRPALR